MSEQLANRLKWWGVRVGVFLFVVFVVWWLFVPPYNVPKFETIENNETGFLIPLNVNGGEQVQLNSAAYLKEKRVATQRVQIHRQWVQRGWLYTTGEYMDTTRLIKVKRESVAREWTQEPASGTSPNDDAITVQAKNGPVIRVAFNCTAFIPESGDEYKHGTEEFLYYYKGDGLENVMDREVRNQVQAAAAEYCAKHSDDTLRGSQHELIEAVKADVIPFFSKRGVAITKLGLSGGFHYVNPAIQKSIDDATAAQSLKVAALAQQEKEKVEAQTKLQNQEIQNKTKLLNAEGEAKAKATELEGTAKAKQAAAKVEAETAKIEAEGKATATKVEADAEAYKMQKLDQFRDLVVSLKTIEVERAWRQLWQGTVPSTVINGGGANSAVPVLPLPAMPPPPPRNLSPAAKQ